MNGLTKGGNILYVWMEMCYFPLKKQNKKNSETAVKQSGGGIMLWGFPSSSDGAFHKVGGISKNK